MNYKLFLSIIIVAVVVGSVFYFNRTPEPQMESQIVKGLGTDPINVIGTRTASTTSAVAFYNYAASTTYPTLIGFNVDTAVYYIESTSASTTAQGGGAAIFSVFTSNDINCDTASTTGGIMNELTKSEVNWYNAIAHVKDLAGSQTLSTATSTITWSITGGDGKPKREIILTDLAARCVMLQVSASSTSLAAQLVLKEN